MRIGIITGEYPPMEGGIGDYTRLLSQHLIEQGAQVSILTDMRARASENLDVASVVTRWDGRAWLQARAWVREKRPDVISLQYQTAAYGMSPWVHFLPNILRPKPFVTTFHDLRYPYLFPKAGQLRTWIVRRLARHSSAIITTNDEDAAALPEIPTKTVIPIGSNIPEYQFSGYEIDAERLRRAQKGEFVISYFGLLNRTKGVHTLIEALAQLRAQSVPARLLIVGGTTGASDPTNSAFLLEIQQEIAARGLQEHVGFTGFLVDRDVALALSACDAIALPYTDGASLRRGSLMAALAHKSAIVTTTPRHADERLVPGKNMLLVPPEDPAALAGALRRLHCEPVLVSTLRAGAAETAHFFRWEHIAQLHLTFFLRVIEMKR